MLELIGMLYRIEAGIREQGLEGEAKLERRRNLSVAVVEEIVALAAELRADPRLAALEPVLQGLACPRTGSMLSATCARNRRGGRGRSRRRQRVQQARVPVPGQGDRALPVASADGRSVRNPGVPVQEHGRRIRRESPMPIGL